MGKYKYFPQGVCSQQITFELEDGQLHDISFYGGCNGNLKAIGLLLEGADAQATVNTLKGNLCGNRSTSCADQLAKAVEQAIKREG